MRRESHGYWVKDDEQACELVSWRRPVSGSVYSALLMDGSFVKLRTYGVTREQAVEMLEAILRRSGWKRLADEDECSVGFDPLSNG